jgi:hypothetical protein
MRKLIVTFVLWTITISLLNAQNKLSQEERAKLTPEQRIVYDNSFRRNGKKKKVDSMSKKVRRAKKEDRMSRRIRPTKNHLNTRKKSK